MTKIGPFKDRRFKAGKTGRRHCECSIGVDYSHSAPVIQMCNAEATWIFFGVREPTCRLGMLLCQEHYDAMTKGGDQ